MPSQGAKQSLPSAAIQRSNCIQYHGKLGIPHIPYDLWDNDMPYSVCEDFVTKDMDLVSAWRIFQTRKKKNDVSVYQHYVNCCLELGVNVVPALDQMIVIDYIIANEDRHLNNFGLLRNAETLQWLGASPIFDSGSSLGYNKVPFDILKEREIICKPFKKSHDEQLKLVSSFDWIDFRLLQDTGKNPPGVLMTSASAILLTRNVSMQSSVHRTAVQSSDLAAQKAFLSLPKMM